MLAPGTAPRETVEGGRVDRAPRAPPRGGPSTHDATTDDRRAAVAGPRPAGAGTARARDASTAGGERFSSSGYPATLLDPIV